MVLPAPFGPRTTQRSSSSTVQSIVVEQRCLPAPDGHAGELEDGGHGAHPMPDAERIGGVASPAVTDVAPARLGAARLVGHGLAARPRGPRPPDRRGHRRRRDTRWWRAREDGLGPSVTALGRLRARRCDALGAALPAEGDPVGLGGPAAFNAAALEAGEAVVVLAPRASPSGLVPSGWARRSPGRPARRRRQLPDVGEADRDLRSALPDSADALASLDVARWRPEVADGLMNLRHRPARRRATRRAAALRGARRAGPPGPGDRGARPGGRRRRA